ncbi:hypothetical protein [Campylobacter sp. VTCC 70190]|uniref:hypothetical protein n=1 Tax=Campylobacter sp. VTCC 70190 TaxID=3392118 RepID=UPI00398EDABD
MNYENMVLNEINEKTQALKTLFDDVKENLSDSALKKRFDEYFLSLENDLKEEIKNTKEKTQEALEELIKEELKENTKALFLTSKQDFLNELKANVDYELLADEKAKGFLRENENKLNEAIREALKGQRFQSLIMECENNLLNSLDEASLKIKQNLEEFKNTLETTHLNYKRMVDEKSEGVLKAYINEHKNTLFKPFNLNFLKDELLKDEELKEELKEIARELIATYITSKGFLKDELEECLLNINKEISEDFFKSEYMKEQIFLNNIVLSNLCLTNELKSLAKIELMLKEYPLIYKKKIYKAV